MDKTAIKNFAIWARNKLKSEIKVRAGFMGITESGIASPLPASTSDIQYFDVASSEPVKLQGREIEMRKRIVSKLEQHAKESGYQTAYDSLIENMASEWFNRLIAIRYMEVNDYFSDGLRMLSSVQAGKQDPDIVSRPFDSDIEFSEKEKEQINDWMNHNKADNLFRFLLLKRCNQLAESLPGLFEEAGDASEFFLRLGFVEKDGFVYKLVHDIEEDVWKDQVQIIGWMYQYYNSEFKDETNASLKKTKTKVKREQIAAVTQLFTPDWIVRYMVENSLGRIWAEGHPDDSITDVWTYYLDEVEQESIVQLELNEIKEEYKNLNLEDMTFIDPCSGSGHILVYAFEVLVKIYESQGYTKREAAKLILKNNLYGIDIDERAYQLTYFALMMKAREYNKRILDLNIRPNVYCIEESNPIARRQLEYFGASMDSIERKKAVQQMNELLDIFKDAKEYGSILTVPEMDFELLRRFAADCDRGQLSLDAFATNNFGLDDAEILMQKLINQAEILSNKYYVVCTNPPYMGNSSMNAKLGGFLKKHYPDSSSDMFAVFMEKCTQMIRKNGMTSMITQQAWMSLGSYEKLRRKISNYNLINMIHLGPRAFDEIGGEMVQTTSFILRKSNLRNANGLYCRLVDAQSENEKEKAFLRQENRYIACQNDFDKIPGAPVSAYMAGKTLAEIYNVGKKINDIGTVRIGMGTGNNDLFLKLWWEVCNNDIDTSIKDFSELDNCAKKYFPYSKGGERRRWYGNHENVIWYDAAGRNAMKNTSGHRENGGLEYYFHRGMTWSYSTMAAFSARVMPTGFVFDVNGSSIFMPDKYHLFTLAFLQSSVGRFIIDSTKSAFSVQAGTIRNLPIVGETNMEIENKTKKCIEMSKLDWNSYENSFQFKGSPLISVIARNRQSFDDISNIDLVECYMLWKQECEDRFFQLKANEEELNRIFIDLYSLQERLTDVVSENDITVHRIFDEKKDVPDSMQGNSFIRLKKDEVISLLSYAVGCMFGRFSLSIEGLAYAGGEWDASKYSNFLPDEDNVIPITDQKYMDDDIVERLCEFLEVVYGEKSLESNLDFIANALGGKGATSREVIRNYFLNDFFKDHCKTYQKRPIYWLFDSGKQNGFKALVYMHRWDKNSIGRVLVYLHKIQEKYEIEVRAIDAMLEHMTDKRQQAAEEQRRDHLLKQIAEIKEYDESLDHMTNEFIDIDLDDGVKVNYEKVQTDRNGRKFKILAPIR
ncbi:MAG: BREX-1 system adenine-specific DNA-methyltransferase PglX [Eubacteriales bacterium]|nr:BREX-1 system adenine-specific DNA-methyltransferase PglX [Eubacteriales bacterium]